jgi:hypothetical protein
MELLKQDLAHNAISTLGISPGDLLLPKEKNEVALPPKGAGDPKNAKPRSESLAPDARRAHAEKAAKARWATWASKKLP